MDWHVLKGAVPEATENVKECFHRCIHGSVILVHEATAVLLRLLSGQLPNHRRLEGNRSRLAANRQLLQCIWVGEPSRFLPVHIARCLASEIQVCCSLPPLAVRCNLPPQRSRPKF